MVNTLKLTCNKTQKHTRIKFNNKVKTEFILKYGCDGWTWTEREEINFQSEGIKLIQRQKDAPKEI